MLFNRAMVSISRTTTYLSVSFLVLYGIVMGTHSSTYAQSLTPTLAGVVVKVHDGDTFTLKLDQGSLVPYQRLLDLTSPQYSDRQSDVQFRRDTVNIRVFGVDAPELGEPYGKLSQELLEGLSLGLRVSCEYKGRSHERVVGRCFLAHDLDVGAAMVQGGLALDCSRYSHGLYRSLEPVGSRQRLTNKAYCDPR